MIKNIDLKQGVECPNCGRDMWVEQVSWQGAPSNEHPNGHITRGPGTIVYTGWARCFICNRWEKIGERHATTENGTRLKE